MSKPAKESLIRSLWTKGKKGEHYAGDADTKNLFLIIVMRGRALPSILQPSLIEFKRTGVLIGCC